MNVWFNSSLLPIAQSPVDEKGWLPGSGIFETIKTVDNIPWAMSQHLARARRASAKIGISLPLDSQIIDAVSKLLASQVQKNGALRLSFDKNGNWAAVHFAYEDQKSAAKLALYPKPISVGSGAIKSYPYSHRLDILEHAKNNGCDEAVVVNDLGFICEGAVSNLLFFIDNKWITPPVSDGVLPGIMRELVLLHLGVEVRSVEVSEITKIHGALLLNSLKIAQSVSEIAGLLLPQMAKTIAFRDEIWAMAHRTSVG